MPQFVIPEEPENEFSDSDWNELVGAMKPGGGDAMSHERSDAVMEVLCPANKVRSACRRILGYSLADDASPWRLRRYETPFCHPRWPWLWAVSVGVELATPLGDESRPHPDYPDATDIFEAKEDAVDWVGYGPDLMAKYQDAKLTVRFAEVTYPIFPDGDAGWSDDTAEFRRFVGFEEIGPKTEIIQAESAQDGSSFKFAETDSPTVAGAPVAGTTEFSGTVYVYSTSASFTVLWKGVEESYCCKGSSIVPKPSRLLDGLGKVNSTNFLGDPEYPPGTMLFDGLRGKRYQFPVRTNSATGLYAWDWYMTFVFADPLRPAAAKDSTGAAIADGVRKRGHHLRPWRGSKRWYYATRGAGGVAGTYAGEGALEEVSFDNMFLHVLDV